MVHKNCEYFASVERVPSMELRGFWMWQREGRGGCGIDWAAPGSRRPRVLAFLGPKSRARPERPPIKYSWARDLSPCFSSTSLISYPSTEAARDQSDTILSIPLIVPSYPHCSLTPARTTRLLYISLSIYPQPQDNGDLHHIFYLSSSFTPHSFPRVFARLFHRRPASIRFLLSAAPATCQQHAARFSRDCVPVALRSGTKGRHDGYGDLRCPNLLRSRRPGQGVELPNFRCLPTGHARERDDHEGVPHSSA